MSDAPINARLTIPNVITSLRLLLLPPFVACVIFQASPDPPDWSRWTAFGLFLFMSVTDMFDGMVARRLRQISRLGAVLDAVADKTLLTVSLVLLFQLGAAAEAGSPVALLFLPWWVLVIALTKDVAVCIGWLILRRKFGEIRLGAGWAGKWCTAAQMVLVLTMLIWFARPGIFGPIARILFVVASTLAVATILTYGRAAIRLLRDSDSPNF